MSEETKETKEKENPEEQKETSKKENQKIDPESKELAKILIVVGLIFLSFIAGYLYVESLKKFNYASIDWTIEDYKDLRLYHGRFPVLYNPQATFNLYIRHDPRKNNIPIEGNLTDFRYGGIVTYTPEARACRDEVTRISVDLLYFMKNYLGMKKIQTASTDKKISIDQKIPHITCDMKLNRTIIQIEKGKQDKIIHSKENPDCYRIIISKCSDISAIEKFLYEIVHQIKQSQKA